MRYHPVGSGSGVAYLGVTPRIYFEDPRASAPTDVEREARALAAWATGSSPSSADPVAALSARIQPLLATADEETWDEADPVELDDNDLFVERKTLTLIAVLGLPEPEGYWDDAD